MPVIRCRCDAGRQRTRPSQFPTHILLRQPSVHRIALLSLLLSLFFFFSPTLPNPKPVHGWPRADPHTLSILLPRLWRIQSETNANLDQLGGSEAGFECLPRRWQHREKATCQMSYRNPSRPDDVESVGLAQLSTRAPSPGEGFGTARFRRIVGLTDRRCLARLTVGLVKRRNRPRQRRLGGVDMQQGCRRRNRGLQRARPNPRNGGFEACLCTPPPRRSELDLQDRVLHVQVQLPPGRVCILDSSLNSCETLEHQAYGGGNAA